MSTLFAIDIDGTIADASRRFIEAGSEPSRDDKERYMAWVAAVQNERSLKEDKPIPGMSNLVAGLFAEVSGTTKVIYLTSREEKWREITDQWLFDHMPYTQALIMRPDGNWDNTGVFKEKMIKLAMAQHGCTECVVIDDDPRGDVALACKRNGWTFLKAGG
jgi:uncharacterized HAD superfamily protein